MIQEWNQTGHQPIIDFLANCDSPAAIAAMGHDLPLRPVDLKFEVIMAAWQAAGSYPPTANHPSKLSPNTLDAIERLLVEVLTDTEDHIGMSWNNIQGPHLRCSGISGCSDTD